MQWLGHTESMRANWFASWFTSEAEVLSFVAFAWGNKKNYELQTFFLEKAYQNGSDMTTIHLRMQISNLDRVELRMLRLHFSGLFMYLHFAGWLEAGF